MVNKLIEWIKEKKELQNLSDELIERSIKGQIPKKELEKEGKSFRKSKILQTIVKETRAELRSKYGVFWNNMQKREKLLEEGKYEELLKLHPSTKERLDEYETLYKDLFKITGKPKSILDLAAGFNAISYKYLGCKPEYYSQELAEEDSKFVQKFFDKEKIKGKAINFDLVEEMNEVSKHKVDVCFLFKALDGLEAVKRNISLELLEKIKAKWIIVSFATKTLGGKKEIQKTKRTWLEKFIKEKNWEFKKHEISNEMFYLIRKSA